MDSDEATRTARGYRTHEALGGELYVSDDSGYEVRERDLAFLSIAPDAMLAMMEQKVPLGMNAQEFDQFCASLETAAQRDGLHDLDARLQGSSAHFFAGRHKSMAYLREALVTDFERERRRYPEAIEQQQVEERMASVWADPDDRPLRRPFDAYYKLGIARDPSDYDVQISSDILAERARAKLAPLGLADEFDIRHATYRYINKALVYQVAPHLHIWSALQSDLLRRSVTLAVFPGSGPERVEDPTQMSSHHQSSDWVLVRGGGERD